MDKDLVHKLKNKEIQLRGMNFQHLSKLPDFRSKN